MIFPFTITSPRAALVRQNHPNTSLYALQKKIVFFWNTSFFPYYEKSFINRQKGCRYLFHILYKSAYNLVEKICVVYAKIYRLFVRVELSLFRAIYRRIPQTIDFFFPLQLLTGERAFFWPPKALQKAFGSALFWIISSGKIPATAPLPRSRFSLQNVLEQIFSRILEKNEELFPKTSFFQPKLFVAREKINSTYELPGGKLVFLSGRFAKIQDHFIRRKEQHIPIIFPDKSCIFLDTSQITLEDVLAASLAKELILSSCPKSTMQMIGYAVFTLLSIVFQTFELLVKYSKSTVEFFLKKRCIFLEKTLHQIHVIENFSQCLFEYFQPFASTLKAEASAAWVLQKSGYNPMALVYLDHLNERQESKFVHFLHRYFEWFFTKPRIDKLKTTSFVATHEIHPQKSKQQIHTIQIANNFYDQKRIFLGLSYPRKIYSSSNG